MEAAPETLPGTPVLGALTRATSAATLLASALVVTYVLLPLGVYLLGVEHEFFLQLAGVSALGSACIWLGSRLPFLDRLVVDDLAKRGVALDAFLVVVWGSFVLFVVLVVATAERVPFLAALQGADPETVAFLRERFLKAREGWQSVFVYVNALLAGTLVPYSLALMLLRRHRWRWMALAFFVIFCLSFVEKVFFLKAAIPVLYLVAQQVVPTSLKPRTVLAGGLLLLALGTVTAGSGTLRDEAAGGDFFTTGFAAQGPLAFVAWRAVAIPVLTAADALRVFQEEHGGRNLGGASSSMLAGLLGKERVNVERQVFAAQFGEAETGNGQRQLGLRHRGIHQLWVGRGGGLLPARRAHPADLRRVPGRGLALALDALRVRRLRLAAHRSAFQQRVPDDPRPVAPGAVRRRGAAWSAGGIVPVTGAIGLTSRMRASLLAASLVAGACGEGGPPSSSPSAPVIAAFSATPPVIVAGGASVLGWDVRGADSVRIEPIPGTLQGTALVVSPASETTYVLVATRAGVEARSTVVLPVSSPAGPPADPPDLRVRGLSGGGVVLSWRLAGLASGYVVERKAGFEADYSPLAVLGGARVVFFDRSATANQLYGYRVRATSVAGSSPGAVAAAVSPPPPPEGPSLAVTPAAVTVAPGADVIFTSSEPVTWSVLEGPAGGTISAAGAYRAPAGAGTWNVVADGGVSAVATVEVR